MNTDKAIAVLKVFCLCVAAALLGAVVRLLLVS